MCTIKSKHHRVRLNASSRADIAWWLQCISIFNGAVGFIDDTPVPSECFTSDACLTGCAAFYCGDWFYSNWSLDHPHMITEHINAMEFYTGYFLHADGVPKSAR